MTGSGRFEIRKRGVAVIAALLVALGLPLLSAAPASALVCTKTYTAGVGGLWSAGGSWAPFGVPSGSDDVCVPSGTVIVTAAQSANAIDVSSGAGLTVLGRNAGGHAALTLAAASTNAGTITLTAADSNWSSTLTGGQLANSGSLITSTGGVGGSRVLNTAVTNTATMTLGGETVTNIATSHATSGALTVPAGGSFTLANGSGANIGQSGGTITNDGSMLLGSGTTFNFGGGSIVGTSLIDLRNANLVVGGSASTSGAAVKFTGGSSTLTGPVPANFSVTVEGNNAGGHATLTLLGASANAGTILLTAANSNWQTTMTGGSLSNSGTLATATGGVGGTRLLNTPFTSSGTVSIGGSTRTSTAAAHVSSGPMSVTVDGSLTLDSNSGASLTQTAGAMTVDGPVLFGAGTTYTFAGGSVVGTVTPEVRSANMVFGPATVTTAAAMLLTGAATTLTGDIPANTTVTIRGDGTGGHATTTLTGASANAGTIILTAANSNWSTTMTGGSLVNTGTLATSTGGVGGTRFLNSPVTSSGSISIDGLTRTSTAAAHATSGPVTVTSAGSLALDNNSGASLTQTAGALTADGPVVFGTGTTYTFDGGSVVGSVAPEVRNANLVFGAGTVTTAATLRTTGNSTLTGDVPVNAAITTQGNGASGNATLTNTATSVNRGTIELTAIQSTWTATLGGSPITNRGIVRTTQGTNGGDRRLNARINNRELIDISGTTFVTSVADHVNFDTINVTATGSIAFQNPKSSLTLTDGVIDLTGPMTFGASSKFFVEGGNIPNGDPVLVNAVLLFEPGTVMSGTGSGVVMGGSNGKLNGSVPADFAVLVRGSNAHSNAAVNVVQDMTNAGTIELASIDSTWSATLHNRTVTNTGTIRTSQGAGGNRALNLDVNNTTGTIDIEGASTSAQSMVNEATVVVDPGANVAYSTGSTFRQVSGSFTVNGAVQFLVGSILRIEGGSIPALAPEVRGATLRIEPGTVLTAPSSVLTSGSSTLIGNVPANLTVTIRGANTGGHAVLTSTANVANDGTIVLSGINSSWNSRLVTPNLVNRGTLRALGAFGGTRTIQGELVNRELVDLDDDIVSLAVTGPFSNATTNARVNVRVDGPATASRVASSGAASLTGRLGITTGYAPTTGQNPQILSATGGVTGTFTTIFGGAPWTVNYLANEVRLVAI